MTVKLFILGCFLSAWTSYAQDISPLYTNDTIKIDGKLEEKAWKQTPKHTDFTYLKVRAKENTTPIPTSFQMLIHADAVILGMRCQEPLMEKRVCKADKGSTDIWGDDHVELFLAPGGLKEKYYQFAVTTANTQWMQYFEGGGITTPDLYDCPIESAVFCGKDFWSVEIRIPLRAFYMTPCAEWQSRWLLNVVRERAAGKVYESLTWSPLNERFHEPDSFRRIGNMPPKPKKYDLALNTLETSLTSRRQDGTFEGNLTVTYQSAQPLAKMSLTVKSRYANVQRTISIARGKNQLVIPTVFKQEGNDKAFLQLKNSAGEVVAERFYPFNVTFQPLKIHFDRPFYAKCFYPGQDASRIKGHIAVTDDCKEITLKVGPREYPLPVKQGKAVFDLPNFQKTGRIALKAIKRHNGAVQAEASATVRILQPTKQKMIWIEAPSRMVVNGKRTFALGWYCGGGRNAYLVSHAFAKKYPSPSDKHPYNFKIGVGVSPANMISGNAEWTKDGKPSVAMLKRVDTIMARWKSRDFDYYYLADEPEFHGGSAIYLKHLYDYIKERDPFHPIMIITTTPMKFIDCADILNPHPYIRPRIDDHGNRSLGRPVRAIVDEARKILASGRADKLIFGTPQTFNYRSVNQYAVFPTFDETNAWIWALICNDGQGLTPFIYYDHASRPDLDLGMDYIYNSIHRLIPYITAPVKPTHLQSDNANVEQRLMLTDQGIMLIVANVTPERQEVRLYSEKLKNIRQLYRFRETGTQDLVKGSLQLSLAPYQVHIFTSQKTDQEMTNLETLRKNIASAEKQRRSSPSILFEKGHQVDIETSRCMITDTMVREDKFFDGVKNITAWKPTHYPATIDLGFIRSVQTFSKVRVYGWDIQAMRFSIKKAGKWIEIPQEPIRKGDYEWELDLGKSVSTVKCRLYWKNYRPEMEVYEIELIK